MQHLLEIGLQVWFWATPIVYTYMLVRSKVAGSGKTVYHVIWYFYRLNPVTPIVLTFQRAIYGKTTPTGANGAPVAVLPPHANQWWYLWQDLVVLAFALILFCLATMLFSRLEGNFAEEL
jgi:ABC-2 type transport system permease protein